MRLNNKAAQHMLPKPSKDDKDGLWAYLKEHHTIGMELRKPFEPRWLLNMSFFTGRQYTFFNHTAWILQQLKKRKGRIRNVDNKILPRVRRQVADGIRTNPIMSVVPSTDDQDDIEAAKIGNKVLRNLWQTARMRKAWRKLQLWKYITGNAFLIDMWDPMIGPTKTMDDGSIQYQGDVGFEVDGPFSIAVPFSALGDDELHKFPWLLRFNWKSLDYIKRVYNADVSSESLPENFFDVSHLFGLPASSSTTKVEGALVIELYRQPCSDYKNGIFLVGANGKIFDKEDYPYLTYPAEQFRDIAVPGIFWGAATMEYSIPLQKTWNRTVSSIDEFNEMMGKGKGLVPRGSKLEALPDDTHGEWLQYKPVMGHKPEIMTLKSLPRTYDLILDITQSSLQDLFSQQEVTRGTNKSDIRSGEMVALLLEQNAIGGIPSHAEDEEALEASMTRGLQRIQVGYKDERILKIYGDEGEYLTFRFKGADLKSNTDVKVKRESTLPDSKVARNQIVERRFEKGFYGPPESPEVQRRVMNMLDDAIVRDIYSEDRLDEVNARIENRTILYGGITNLLINPYDNHIIHVKEHNKARKSRDFQKLKLTNPSLFFELDLVIEGHIQQHMKYIRRMMKNAAESEGKVTPIGGGRGRSTGTGGG